MGGAETSGRSWRESLAVYADRRMALIFAMGFSSGLPLALTMGTLDWWMSEVGVDLKTIGLFALVGLPYSLKFLWAPAMDQVRLPFLGRRRSWALVTQAGLAASIAGLALADPARGPALTAAWALAVAFWSASQDVVIDAYRIEILAQHEQGAGAAATQLGYRLGMLTSGAGAFVIASYVPWSTVYLVMAALVGVGMVTVLAAPEPQGSAAVLGAEPVGAVARLRTAVWEPLAEFSARRGWVAILLFAVLYKFGDAVSGKMTSPFYYELGFTKIEVASVTKVWAIVATSVGIAAGGSIVAALGSFRALLLGGVLQASTNLLFSALALVGHSVPMLAVAVGADNFTGGLAGTAFVAYLSALCSKRFTATQFALLTSLSATGRTVLSAGSGYLAKDLGWAPFFAATAGLAIPGLLLLLWLMRLRDPEPEPPLSPAPEAS